MSPDRSISDADRDRPVAFVQPLVHKSSSTFESSRRNSDRTSTVQDAKNEFYNPTASELYNSENTNERRTEIELEEFDNSLFILCIVSIFLNPVIGPIASYSAWRAKKAFFASSWKSFRRWTVAAHAFSSIALGISAIAIGMIGIKLYHMYSGIQCFYKCSFLTNNEFNWQGFWDELNKNRNNIQNGA